MYEPAMPDSHAESPQPNPVDPPASDPPTSSDPMSSMASVPGPPQDPPSAPLHSLPMPPQAGPPGSLAPAPGGDSQLGGFGSQAPMQQLQAALSAQSQVTNTLLVIKPQVIAVAATLPAACCCPVRCTFLLPMAATIATRSGAVLPW